MTLDDDLTVLIDRTLTELRSALQTNLHAFAQDFQQKASAAQAATVQDAVAAAQRESQAHLDRLGDELAQVRRTFETEVSDIRRLAAAEIEGARRQMDAQLDESSTVLAAARRETDEARRETESARGEAGRLQRELGEASRAVGAADQERASLQQALDAATLESRREIDESRRETEAARGEVDRLARELGEASRAAAVADQERASLQQSLGAAALASRREVEGARHETEEARRDVGAARREAEAARSEIERLQRELEHASRAAEAAGRERAAAQQSLEEVRHAATLASETLSSVAARTQQIVDAVRAIDSAGSIGDVLERLAQAAKSYAQRTVLLMVRDSRLMAWRAGDFPGITSTSLPIDAGIVGRAVSHRQAQACLDGTPESEAMLPSFADDGRARDAVALPVVLGGETVAVLYADTPRGGADAADRRWFVALDVVTRYASRVIEAMTLQRSVGLSAAPRGSQPRHDSETAS